ncbi:uncharacterized protein LOC129907136 [Episyrphus balteatus]|uniref:uncharacterized protein LOC129907136 n=1 Tax=Episyrphus balteatus TaxID=286459 RepID=UPI00248636F1|nr:uncharacterized protein LOC129907136 [Episyrphus balteatus]
MLNIFQEPEINESVSKYEYHTYSPYQNNFERNDIIQISIQHQNLDVLPSESFLYIEGLLSTTDVKEITINNNTKLVNNAMAFLFDEIRYELNGKEIDYNRNVGITSTIKNYLSLTKNESDMLLNASWSPDSPISLKPFQFNYCIPLNKLLGFAEDYKKIIPNARHDLIITRARVDENALISPTNEKVQINIQKIQWKVPHVTLSDSMKLNLYKSINKNNSMKIAFRNWDLYEYPMLPSSDHHIWNVKTTTQIEKPRYIVFALQTGKNKNLTADPTTFDHCSLTDLKVYLNSDVYPHEDLNVSFEKNRYSLFYRMYADFQKTYYNKTSSEPLLSWDLFKSRAPIFVVDCRYQNEALKTGAVDIRLEMRTSKNIPANTSANCLMLHDRIIEYNPLDQVVNRIV